MREDYITQNRMIEEAVADGTDVIVFSAIDYEGECKRRLITLQKRRSEDRCYRQ